MVDILRNNLPRIGAKSAKFFNLPLKGLLSEKFIFDMLYKIKNVKKLHNGPFYTRPRPHAFFADNASLCLYTVNIWKGCH